MWPVRIEAWLGGVFGLLIGSFLNVCIYRLPRDLSVVTPRSFCTECGTQIAWHENVPVLSYAVLRGKCKHCAKRISWRYPVVELTTAVLFAAVMSEYGFSLAALKWLIFESILVALFWIDVEERLLPDVLTLSGTVFALLFAFFVPVPGILAATLTSSLPPWAASLSEASAGALILAVPIWALGRLYYFIRKREGLGFGDVKLLMMVGAFLGLEEGLIALTTGCVAGCVIGGAFILWKRHSANTYELPLGSFLCAAAGLVPIISIPWFF